MSKNYWDYFVDEISVASCNNCPETTELHILEDELWCKDCLMAETVEDHPSLTLEERNQ